MGCGAFWKDVHWRVSLGEYTLAVGIVVLGKIATVAVHRIHEGELVFKAEERPQEPTVEQRR